MKNLRYRVGDHVRCYREAPDGATGVVVATRPNTTSPYKIRWDEPNPFTGEQGENWVSRVAVYGRVAESADRAAREHREWLAGLSQAAIDHAYEEYRAWAGESERDAAVRDTNHVLEQKSAAMREPRKEA